MASLGDPAGGRPMRERSTQLATQVGDEWCQTNASQILAIGWIFQGEFDISRQMLDDACVIAARVGYRRGIALHWFCLGWVATFHLLTWHLAALGTLERMAGNLDAAWAHGEQALEVARQLGSGWMQACAERLLGRVALAAGKTSEAARYVHDALDRLVAKGFAIDILECFDILAAIAATQDKWLCRSRGVKQATLG